MNTPKFSIYEEVLIYSSEQPEINGEEAVVIERQFHYNIITVKGFIASGWCYKCEPHIGVTGVWHETALRKRPSDMSYDELMENLKKSVEKKEPELV